MTAKPVIESRTNPLLKRVGAVAAGRERGTLLLEGERLVRDALRAGWPLELLLVDEAAGVSLDAFEGDVEERRTVGAGLLGRVSALKTSPGVLALAAAPPPRALRDIPLAADALVLVIAGVSDPGNLGALVRSAEAAGAAAVCVVAGGASPWTPRALRGSMGSSLRVPMTHPGSADALAEDLVALDFRSVRAVTRGGAGWRGFDWSGRVALWVGAETGDEPATMAGLEGVSIPMAGDVESLNVTVATSLLLFAAGRAEERAS